MGTPRRSLVISRGSELLPLGLLMPRSLRLQQPIAWVMVMYRSGETAL